MMTTFQIRKTVQALRQGEVIAYPTEAVWGLGCDPNNPAAISTILTLKQRAWQKGLILIASEWAQLAPFCQTPNAEQTTTMQATWPGPNTWLVPAATNTPNWLKGTHSSIAVRVTDHPLVTALCDAYGGAIVSTSANPAGKLPALNALKVRRYFTDKVWICNGNTGGSSQPSTIRDLSSGRTIRSGA